MGLKEKCINWQDIGNVVWSGRSNAQGFFNFFLFQVKAISLTPEVFTVENGLLTPTLKFKRPALKTHLKQTFEDLYSTLPE